MINFPKSTEFNKKIAKQKFYNKLQVSSRLERQFVKEIDNIYWKNKLSAETLNVNEGSSVKEIEIIEINLKEKNIGQNIMEFIDREIPYHIVFILRYEQLGQIYISYKEDSKSRQAKFKVDSYFKTGWVDYNDLSLKINGLNLDKIYENFIIQVAEDKLPIENSKDLKEAVSISKDRDKLLAYADSLENKIKNEKQFNIQVKLAAELREVKNQLKEFI